MGSRILSRSFVVERWAGDEDENEAANGAANTSLTSAMDIDEQNYGDTNGHHSDQEEDGDNEDEEDSSDVAMVPMADMLNARYQTENVGVFCGWIEFP